MNHSHAHPSADTAPIPSARTAPIRTRTKLALLVVSAIAIVLAAPGVSPASSSAAESSSEAESALARASANREAAEDRLAAITAERDAMMAQLQGLDEDSAELTQDLVAARKAVREYAIAAYIDGGQTDVLKATLNAEQSAALAWRTNLVAGQTVSEAEAVDNYSALKDANEPERIAAATELDRLNSRVEEASNDAIQAAAHERDAENDLAAARQAEQAAAEAARAAEAEKARAAAASKAEASKAAPAQSSSSGSSSSSSKSTPAPSRSTPAPAPAPSSSSGSGNTSSSESATLARIRACESGGNYGIVSASGRYRGAYQFDYGTWGAMGGSGDPAAASPGEQDYRALLLLRARGSSPWPNCG